MQKIYPIRPKQADLYLTAIIIPILYLAPSIVLAFFGDMLPFNSWKNFIATMIIGGIAAVLTHYYFKPKVYRLSLIIDDNGISTNSQFFNIITNIKKIHWNEISHIIITKNPTKEVMGKYFAKNDPYLKEFDDCLIIHTNKKNNFIQKPINFAIQNNLWQIDDMNELIEIFNQKGYPITTMDSKTYIKENIPQMKDLGKRSGNLAYAAILLFILADILFYFDKVLTLDFGHIDTVFFIIAIIIFILGTYYIYQENKELNGAVSLIIFVPMATLFLLALTLLISPMLGNKQQVDFDFKDGIWQSKYNQIPLQIECRKNKAILTSDGKVNIVDTLSMIRISRDEIEKLCVNGKFIKN